MEFVVPSQFRRFVRDFFQWQYTGVVIGLLLAAGLSMTIDHRFAMADALFLVTGIWMLCWWFTSDFLEKQRVALRRRHIKRNPDSLSKAQKELRRWFGGVSFLIVAGTGVCMWYNHQLKDEFLAGQLKAARDDVFDRLTVQPLPFPTGETVRKISVAITNASRWNVGSHTLGCNVRSIRNARNTGFVSSVALPPVEQSLGLLAGGRGETIDCMAMVDLDPPVTCADLLLRISFALEDQPTQQMTKDYRYSYRENGNIMQWIQESPKVARDYCKEQFTSRRLL